MRTSRQYWYHFIDSSGMAEELDLHLLELAAAEGVVPRVDLVAKRLADLGDAERQLEPRAVEDVAEVDEDALGGFGAEVGLVLLRWTAPT